MPQHKTVKRAKTKRSSAAKRSVAKQDVLELVAKIENEFRHVPARLVALCRQEQDSLKHRETKLKNALKITESKQKILEKKQVTLSHQKKSGNKKQMAQLKKLIASNVKSMKDLVREIKELTHKRSLLEHKQFKFTSLGKELLQLEKRLNAKKAAKTAKTHKKPMRRTVVKRFTIPATSSTGDSVSSSTMEFKASDSNTIETS